MSQIEGSLGSTSLAGQVVFAAAAGAARRSPAAAAGMRAAMARAGRLLVADARLAAYGDGPSAPLDAGHEGAAPRTGERSVPTRRRTRRYAERRALHPLSPH